MILVRVQCSLNKDHQHLKMTAAKVMDKKIKASRMFRTSSRRCIRLYSDQKWKMHQRHFKKFPSQNVQIFGYVYQSTNGQNHGPVWKDQSFFSKGISFVILWQDYYGKGNSRKFYCTDGKSFKLEMSICQPSKRTVLIFVCGRYQIGKQDRKHKTDLENSQGRR